MGSTAMLQLPCSHAGAPQLCLGLGPGSALPNAARVVLRPSDDRVALVVERARKNLVLVPVQRLQLIPGLRGPHFARLVTRRRDYLVALGVELDL